MFPGGDWPLWKQVWQRAGQHRDPASGFRAEPSPEGLVSPGSSQSNSSLGACLSLCSSPGWAHTGSHLPIPDKGLCSAHHHPHMPASWQLPRWPAPAKTHGPAEAKDGVLLPSQSSGLCSLPHPQNPVAQSWSYQGTACVREGGERLSPRRAYQLYLLLCFPADSKFILPNFLRQPLQLLCVWISQISLCIPQASASHTPGLPFPRSWGWFPYGAMTRGSQAPTSFPIPCSLSIRW